jgi:hypothetical protein
MKKFGIFFGLAPLVAVPCIFGNGGNAALATSAAGEGEGEGEVVSSGEVSVSETTSETSSETTSESSTPATTTYEYRVMEAVIGYRDSEDVSYAKGDSRIGSYFLSADGWNDGDTYDITMTITGNVTTKLADKVVYIYEYRPTLVKWCGNEISMNGDKTYTLAKPTEKGDYALEINFTKTMITNPMDLTSINWSSLLTVQNLMTIGSWVVIIVGILILYGLNRRYKKRGSTTLEEVKKSISSEIENVYGVEMAKSINSLLDTSVKAAFTAIDEKLSKLDNNNATLVRCLLVMQENTPEARLAVTKYLSELDTAEDSKAEEVKKLIEAEMEKYKADQEAKEKALEEARKVNEQWKDKATSTDTEPKEAIDSNAGDGTTI